MGAGASVYKVHDPDRHGFRQDVVIVLEWGDDGDGRGYRYLGWYKWYIDLYPDSSESEGITPPPSPPPRRRRLVNRRMS